MTILEDFRRQYPHYDDMPDMELLDALYQKFYSDLPRLHFDRAIGATPTSPVGADNARPDPLQNESSALNSRFAGNALTSPLPDQSNRELSGGPFFRSLNTFDNQRSQRASSDLNAFDTTTRIATIGGGPHDSQITAYALSHGPKPPAFDNVSLPPPPFPTLGYDRRGLGGLSMRYETGYGPGQAGLAAGKVSSGKDDPGGVSYGAYQLSSKTGRVQAFLQAEGLPWADKFRHLIPTERGGLFGQVWQQQALENPVRSFNAQHQFVERTQYDPVVQNVFKNTGLDINNQSRAVQNVVWSMAVQHKRAADLVTQAVKNLDGKVDASDPIYQAALINELYDLRGPYVIQSAIQSSIHPKKGLPQGELLKVQWNLLKRYERERDDALNMLKTDGEGEFGNSDAGFESHFDRVPLHGLR